MPLQPNTIFYHYINHRRDCNINVCVQFHRDVQTKTNLYIPDSTFTMALSASGPQNQPELVCQTALTLLDDIEELQTMVRTIELKLDQLAWHVFSIAIVASDTDPDTMPPRSEIETLDRQVSIISDDISSIAPHISTLRSVLD